MQTTPPLFTHPIIVPSVIIPILSRSKRALLIAVVIIVAIAVVVPSIVVIITVAISSASIITVAASIAPVVSSVLAPLTAIVVILIATPLPSILIVMATRCHVPGWTTIHMLPRILLLLSLLVVHKVIKDARGVLEAVNNLQHLQPLWVGHLLRVPGVGHRLVLVILQPDLTQQRVGHVLHVDPLHLEHATPLVLRPHRRLAVVVHRANHLRNATEVARSVDREEEQHVGLVRLGIAVRLIQALVAVFSGAPDSKKRHLLL